MFVGCDANSKRYNFYNPIRGKIVLSRDMEFDEDGYWDWNVPNENYDFLFLFDGYSRS